MLVRTTGLILHSGPVEMERDLSTALQRAIEAGDQVLTAEVMPPRGADPSHMLAMAASLQGRVHAVNVTDGSRAVMRMSSLASCKLLLEAGLEPVLQMACRDRNRIALQADLLGAHALGIRNLLCLTGDPVRAGDQADARPVNEFESVKLLQQVDSLNRGVDPVQGTLPDGATTLFAGCAADPQSRSWSGLQRRLQRKQAAGFLAQAVLADRRLIRVVGRGVLLGELLVVRRFPPLLLPLHHCYLLFRLPLLSSSSFFFPFLMFRFLMFRLFLFSCCLVLVNLVLVNLVLVFD